MVGRMVVTGIQRGDVSVLLSHRGLERHRLVRLLRTTSTPLRVYSPLDLDGSLNLYRPLTG